MRRKITIEQKLHQQSEEAKSLTVLIILRALYEALVRKARQLKTASQIDRWISSPASQPPK